MLCFENVAGRRNVPNDAIRLKIVSIINMVVNVSSIAVAFSGSESATSRSSLLAELASLRSGRR